MMTEREFQERLHQLTQPIPQETHRAFLRGGHPGGAGERTGAL